MVLPCAPWKVIGQYRNVQLPELPIPIDLPHPLGQLPSYFNKPPPPKEPVEPVEPVEPKEPKEPKEPRGVKAWLQ